MSVFWLELLPDLLLVVAMAAWILRGGAREGSVEVS